LKSTRQSVISGRIAKVPEAGAPRIHYGPLSQIPMPPTVKFLPEGGFDLDHQVRRDTTETGGYRYAALAQAKSNANHHRSILS